MNRGLACAAAMALVAGIASGAGREGDGKTLTLMHIQVAKETLAAVEAAVKRFEAATGASVRCEAIRNDQYKQKIAVTLPSASPPDVFHTWGGGGLAAYVKDGLVAPLPDDFPAAGMNEQALGFCKVDERLYAAPVDVSIVAFWYRKSVFEKARAEIPRTTDELLKVCAMFRAAGVTPIALGNSEHWPGAFYFDYALVRLDAMEGGVVREYLDRSTAGGQPARTKGSAQAEAFVRSLAGAGIFPDGFRGSNYNDSRAMFFDGRAAMTLMGSWMLSYAISDRPEIVPDLGVFAFPATAPGGRADELLGGVNAAYAVSARCAEKRLAARLVEFLTDESAATDWVKTGRIPARAVKVEGVPPVLADTMKMLGSAKKIELYFDQALPPAVAEKHKAYTQSLFEAGQAVTWVKIAVVAVAVMVLAGVGFALRRVFRRGSERG